MTAGNKGIDTMMVNNEEIAMLHATGVPIQIKNIKLKLIDINTSLYFSLSAAITVYITRKYLINLII